MVRGRWEEEGQQRLQRQLLSVFSRQCWRRFAAQRLLWQVVVGGGKKAEELLLRGASGRNRVRTKMRYRVRAVRQS